MVIAGVKPLAGKGSNAQASASWLGSEAKDWLAPDSTARNTFITQLRAPAELVNSLLKHFKGL